MDRDEVPGFNHFTRVEKETDVQARGCRRNSGSPPAPVSVTENQRGSSDLN